MNRMNALLGLACSLSLLTACKKEEAPPPPPKPEVKEEPPKPEEPKPLTAEEYAKWYQDCWGKYNAKAWDDFKKCFHADIESEDVDSGMPVIKGADAVIAAKQTMGKGFPDMMGEAQLILVSGDVIVGAWLLKGTNSGPMIGPDGKEAPATNKKVGLLFGHVIQGGKDGKGAQKEWAFMDMAAMAGQLGLNPMPHRPAMEKGAEAPTVVIAADDQKEKDNLAVLKKETELYNKHDLKALTDLYTDDLVWSEAAMPDTDKKGMLKNLTGMYKGFSDMKLTSTVTIAAGDFVADIGVMDGTNDGDMPDMKLKKTGKKVSGRYLRIAKIDGGKIKQSWLFYNSMASAQQLGLVPPPGGAPPAKGDAPKGDVPPAEPPKKG